MGDFAHRLGRVNHIFFAGLLKAGPHLQAQAGPIRSRPAAKARPSGPHSPTGHAAHLPVIVPVLTRDSWLKNRRGLLCLAYGTVIPRAEWLHDLLGCECACPLEGEPGKITVPPTR